MTPSGAVGPARTSCWTEPPAYWDFIGPSKSKPFRPHSENQAAIFDTVQIPWPGLDDLGRPYPRLFGMNCGRRYGKTTVLEALLWKGLMADDDQFGPPCVRMAADTEEHALKVWDKFIYHLTNTPLSGLIDDYSKDRQLVRLRNGANAQMISLHNPNAASGDGVSLWILDEAQFITLAAWVNLYPSTTDRNGVIVMAGVSQGEGPFKEICYRGDTRSDPECLRIHRTTAQNPMITPYAIERAREQMTANEFRQLYLAEWVGELGKIFRNVEGCLNGAEVQVAPSGYGFTEARRAGKAYYGGLDLARLQDWTVYTIWDRDGNLVAWDRFNMVGWELQKARIYEFSKAYGHPHTIVDATGVGDPVYDDLLGKGMNVEAYKINSNDKKRILIDELAIRIGAGQVRYPRIGQLVSELNRMEARKAGENSMVIKYEAPAGWHDDFVMSAALAMQVVPRPPSYPQQDEDAAPVERYRSAAEFI